MNKRKLLCLLSVIFVLAGGTFVRAAAPAANARLELVAAGRVGEAENISTRRYPGRVVSPASIAVTARVSGDLLEIGFKEGDFVKKGQLLYRLDDIRYLAAKRSAEAKIAEYKARVAYSKANFDRTRELFEKDVSTQDELESARSEYEAYQATLAAAEADLIVADDDLKNTRIVAPADGRIGVNAVPVGSYVTPSSGTLSTVVQMDPVRVRFSLSNRDFLTLFGDEQTLRDRSTIKLLLANGSEYGEAGKLDFIDNTTNEQTDTLQIYVVFPNERHRLSPGSTISVLLGRTEGTKLPVVLPSAVMYDSDGTYVYVLDENNVVSRRDIELAQATQDLQFVKSGLEVGERIIIDGTHKAIPGKPVNVVEDKDADADAASDGAADAGKAN